MKNRQLSPKINFNPFLFLFLFSIFLPFITSAQVLGKYEFTGVSTADNQFNQVTTQPEKATFSPLTRTGVHWYKGENVYNSRNWQSPTNTQVGYIEFTITAQAGNSLNLTQLIFQNYRTQEGPGRIKVAHNASGNFSTDTLSFTPSVSTLSTTTWDFNDIITETGATVTFRIYGYNAGSWLGNFRIDNLQLSGTVIPLKINEFHYANTKSINTGFVEVVAPKDLTDLNSVAVTLYDGDGSIYGTHGLGSFKSEPSAVYGNERIYYINIPTGLADAKGGISLSYGTSFIQFISYGGILKPTSGPAVGISSKDIGITETTADGDNNSVFLTDINSRAGSTPVWTKGANNTNTKGFANWEMPQTLPVELLYLEAQATTKGVNLVWATAAELNNDYFLIEKNIGSANTFQTIAKIKGAGNSQEVIKYNYTDEQHLGGTAYYRLKQVDLDGTFSYSSVVAVKSKAKENELVVYPNPVNNQLNLNLGDLTGVNEMQVQIISLTGKVMYQNANNELLKFNNYVIPVSDLLPGHYFCVVYKDGIKETKAFIKL